MQSIRMAQILLLLGAALLHPAAARESTAARRGEVTWQAKGTLFEACSCSVPCPCNFGQSPSRGYCNTIYAYRLSTAKYEGITLDGLVFGGGAGPSGAVAYL